MACFGEIYFRVLAKSTSEVKRKCIGNNAFMSLGDAVMAGEVHSSYGTLIFDHLAADGASLAGGQVTVVTVGQVDADLRSGLHLELVHGLTGLGHIDLVIVLHTVSLLFYILGKKNRFPRETIFFPQAYFYPVGCKYVCFFSERHEKNGNSGRAEYAMPLILDH